MIVGASYHFEPPLDDEKRRRLHDIVMRRALAELIPFVEVGRTYQLTFEQETISVHYYQYYQEYRILIRCEDITR